MVSLLVMWFLTGLWCDWESLVLLHSWVRLQLKFSHCHTGSQGSPSLTQMSSMDEVVTSLID